MTSDSLVPASARQAGYLSSSLTVATAPATELVRRRGWLRQRSSGFPPSRPKSKKDLNWFINTAEFYNSHIASVGGGQGSSVSCGSHCHHRSMLAYRQGWLSPSPRTPPVQAGRIWSCNHGTPLSNTARMAQLGLIDMQPIRA